MIMAISNNGKLFIDVIKCFYVASCIASMMLLLRRSVHHSSRLSTIAFVPIISGSLPKGRMLTIAVSIPTFIVGTLVRSVRYSTLVKSETCLTVGRRQTSNVFLFTFHLSRLTTHHSSIVNHPSSFHLLVVLQAIAYLQLTHLSIF